MSRMDARTVYPFELLKHGESFDVPCTGEQVQKTRNVLSVTAAGWHAHPDNFCRFTVRMHDAGVRVTRVA